MFDFIAGLLVGIYLTVFGFCIFLGCPLSWLICIGILGIILLSAIKVYLVVTDYKRIAESGIKSGQKIYTEIKNKLGKK